MTDTSQLNMFLSVGTNCELALGKDDQLYMIEYSRARLVRSVVCLGTFTDQLLENIKGGLDRLAIHTVVPVAA